MKKIILTILFALIATFSFSQPNYVQHHFRPEINLSQYNVVDSLPLERITIHFDKEIDDERFISLGSGDYMAPLPHNDKIIIKTNEDRTKAIVLYNSYCFGRHLEFDIQENEKRIVLYNQNDKGFCGYIYDKKYKVAKYFESKKEYKHFMKRPLFMKIN